MQKKGIAQPGSTKQIEHSRAEVQSLGRIGNSWYLEDRGEQRRGTEGLSEVLFPLDS